jgi:CRISPR-associated exonuclease Cas4
LIHVEQLFVENVHTVRGTSEHDRASDVGSETRDGVRIARDVPLWSERLGLVGKADIVEFHPDGSVYPVEYKHGRRRRWINDDIQVCAEALCLEEMLGKHVPVGAIFHLRSRRRREVTFDERLRNATEEVVAGVAQLLGEGRLPSPILTSRCRQCSMRSVCLPEIRLGRDARWLFEPIRIAGLDT